MLCRPLTRRVMALDAMALKFALAKEKELVLDWFSLAEERELLVLDWFSLATERELLLLVWLLVRIAAKERDKVLD